MAYVKEVGYIQDASARILKSKKSYTLGILISDISLVGLEHPFFSSILQSFKNYVEKQGYEIIFGAIDASIVKNAEFNPLAGISIFDNQDKTLNNASIVITGTVDNTTAGTYTLTDRQGNVTSVERVVTVTEPTA